MGNELVLEVNIEDLLSTDAGRKVRQVLETISTVQKGLTALAENEDDEQLDLLKIGTVFQIFFIDTLASGKKVKEFSEDDWKNIAGKVYQYAVLEEGQLYSEFVFNLYADYIDVSIETLRALEGGGISDQDLAAIKTLSDALRENDGKLKRGETGEAAYIEDCLWLSLEAMMKLLYTFFTAKLPKEYAGLIRSASQFAFEYGRYVLYAKEQALLERYIRNQHVLDEQLQREYELYLEEVRVQAEAFRGLVENAFSSDIREALENSAALARAAGVKEEEILKTTDDVDAFFLE